MAQKQSQKPHTLGGETVPNPRRRSPGDGSGLHGLQKAYSGDDPSRKGPVASRDDGATEVGLQDLPDMWDSRP